MTSGDPAPDDALDGEQLESQEAVEVPARDDLSVIAAEPTGSKHGDAETAERISAQVPPDERPGV